MKQTRIFFVITLLFLVGCSSDDNGNMPKPVNQPPNAFEVTATADDKGLGFSLEWTVAIDPDEDTVTYEVILDGISQAEELSDFTYTLEGVGYETLHSGMVIATDSKGASTQTAFTVTTSSFVNIPNPLFEEFLINEGIDSDRIVNQQMHYINAQGVEEINIPSEISTIEGIDVFVDLKIFNCNFGNLTYVDFSKNTALEELSLYENELTEIDLSRNTKLRNIYIGVNALTELDVTNNTLLEVLDVSGNALTELDVTNNTLLEKLDVRGNALTELDIRQLTRLQLLIAGSNPLTEIDLSANSLLERLSLSTTNITSLDLSNNAALERLYVEHNQLTALDLSHNPALRSFIGVYNQFVELDFSNNINIYNLHCFSNSLQKLDLRIGDLSGIASFNSRNNNPDLVVCVDAEVPDRIRNGLDPTATISEVCD